MSFSDGEVERAGGLRHERDDGGPVAVSKYPDGVTSMLACDAGSPTAAGTMGGQTTQPPRKDL